MKERTNAAFLRITLLSGIILFIVSGIILTVFYIGERKASEVQRQKDSFRSIMREYDLYFDGLFFTESEFTRLNEYLDRMEKTAVSVESWLSIIKRRRALADIHPSSLINYKQTIEKALLVYPSSETIALIASCVFYTEQKGRDLLSLINDTSLNKARLYLHILLGDFNNPASASSIPDNIHSEKIESIAVNLALLKILRRDYKGASGDIQIMINDFTVNSNETSEVSSAQDEILLSPASLFFAAEFFYDFGNPLRSAEIFSYIEGEKAMSRQADALYLSDFTEAAAALWNKLAENSRETSLYNLAITTKNRTDAFSYLERLINIEPELPPDSMAKEFALILYSRGSSLRNAVSFIQKRINNQNQNHPYIDLEICRRNSREQTPGKQIADIWYLLDRHDNNIDIYNWSLRNMIFLRDFNETKILIDRLSRLNINDPRLNFYKALFLMNKGDLENAEKILREITDTQSDWRTNANLARTLEAAAFYKNALEQYQIAAEKLEDIPASNKNASLVYSRIARCYKALKRPGDALRSLQTALEYDAGNLAAQLELEYLIR